MWKSNPSLHMHARKNRLIPRDKNRNGDEHKYHIRHKAQAIQKAFVAQNSKFIINTRRIVVVTAKCRQPFPWQTNNIFDFNNQTNFACARNVLLHAECYTNQSSRSYPQLFLQFCSLIYRVTIGYKEIQEARHSHRNNAMAPQSTPFENDLVHKGHATYVTLMKCIETV